MNKEIFASERSFQVWSYIVSHRQLLLRSPKAAEFVTRVDILFKGVDLILISTTLNGPRISIVDPDSADAIWLKLSCEGDRQLYHIETDGASGLMERHLGL